MARCRACRSCSLVLSTVVLVGSIAEAQTAGSGSALGSVRARLVAANGTLPDRPRIDDEETTMKRIRRILHPTDFSSASRPAFERALGLARDSRAELIIPHVLAPVIPVVGEGYIPPQTYEAIHTAAPPERPEKLDALVARARKAGVRARALVLEGTAHERIVSAARAQRVDLIVMGTHGRSGLARLFIGSVANRVVSAARCPVMTVRGR